MDTPKRQDETPEMGKYTIVVTKIRFWIVSALIVVSFMGTVVFPVTYVNEKNYKLDEALEATHKHEKDIERLKSLVPQIESLSKDMRVTLEELKKSNENWIQLFREFDLRKK